MENPEINRSKKKGDFLKKWRLPRWNRGISEQDTSPSADWNLEELMSDLDDAYADYKGLDTDNESGKAELRQKIEGCKKALSDYRATKFVEDIEHFYSNDEADTTEERGEPVVWDGTKAGTMVSHFIYRGKERLPGKPLLYVLEDPNTRFSINLIQIYREAESENAIMQAMLLIWKQIKLAVIKETVSSAIKARRTPSNFKAAWLVDIERITDYFLNTAGPELTGRHMDLLYGSSKKRSLTFKIRYVPKLRAQSEDPDSYEEFDDDRFKDSIEPDFAGEIVMNVSFGVPGISDLDGLLCSRRTKAFVNEAFSGKNESKMGLFVSLQWNDTARNKYGQHCLYLSEYNIHKVHATLCCGFSPKTLNSDNVSHIMQQWEVQELALEQEYGGISEKYEGSNPWKKLIPLREHALTRDLLVFTNGNNASQEDGLSMIGNFKARMSPEWISDMIKVDYFSADNITYFIVSYNTTYDFISQWLGKAPSSQMKWYVQMIVMRYPAIGFDPENFMYNIQKTYYKTISHNRDDKWQEWRKGRYHLPAQVENFGERPEDFPELPASQKKQEIPFVTRKNTHGQIVFPFKKLTSLPPRLSHGEVSDPSRIKTFFVNGLETQANIVFKFKPTTVATYNDLQLFRLNAEIEVSGIGYLKHGEGFYDFRQRADMSTISHPFLAYLDKYPELRMDWHRIWVTKYPGMRGWTRFIYEVRNRAPRDRHPEPERDDSNDRQQLPIIDEEGADEEPAEAGEAAPMQESKIQQSRVSRAYLRIAKQAALRRRNERALIQMLYRRTEFIPL